MGPNPGRLDHFPMTGVMKDSNHGGVSRKSWPSGSS